MKGSAHTPLLRSQTSTARSKPMEGGEASWAVGKMLELLPDAWSLGSSVLYTKTPRLMVCSFLKTKHLFMFKKYLKNIYIISCIFEI